MDLYKADVYSLGLCLLECITNEKIANINTDKSRESSIYTGIHQNTTIPLLLKQLLFQMLRFDQKERISTFVLYRAMANINLQFRQSVDIFPKTFLGPKADLFTKIPPIFEEDILREKFDLYKLRFLSHWSENFYTGPLKVEYDFWG